MPACASMGIDATLATVALIAAGTAAAWAGPAIAGQPATGLEVRSVPTGAAVYVDGQLKGATPVAVEGIVSGEHTVRVVKDGFLENSRVVSVPAAGRSLSVVLTPAWTRPRAPAAQVKPGEENESGGGKKRVFIGLGAAVLAGGGILAYTLTRNTAPVVSGVTASPSTALQSATPVSFAASATDQDKDSLTYTWDFGDGSTGTGASPSHVYPSAGAYDVTVEVSDGEKQARGSTHVTVKSMAGRWTGRLGGSSPITFDLLQNGSKITGSYQAVYPGNRSVAGIVTGSVTSPRRVTMTARVRDYWPLHYDAPLDPGLDSLSGTVTEADVPYPFSLVRQ